MPGSGREPEPTGDSTSPEAAARTRRDIDGILNAEIETAMARFNKAALHFRQVVSEVPSGIPHPDGSLRITIASQEKKLASEALARALKRHNDFLLDGRVPDDLPGKQQ